MVTPAASVRTFDLFSQILNCASRGQLTPATIDATLRSSRSRAAARTRTVSLACRRVRQRVDWCRNGRSDGGRSERTGPTSERTGPTEATGPPDELLAQISPSRLRAAHALYRFRHDGDRRLPACAAGRRRCRRRVWRAGAARTPGGTAASSLILRTLALPCSLSAACAPAVRRADGAGPQFVPAIALTPLEDTVRPGEELRVMMTALSLIPATRLSEPDGAGHWRPAPHASAKPAPRGATAILPPQGAQHCRRGTTAAATARSTPQAFDPVFLRTLLP